METKYDAIVVGTGVSGGWAAKELCEKGLKTLVLERGRMIKHIEDYPTMNNDPWDYESGEVITNETKRVPRRDLRDRRADGAVRALLRAARGAPAGRRRRLLGRGAQAPREPGAPQHGGRARPRACGGILLSS